MHQMHMRPFLFKVLLFFVPWICTVPASSLPVIALPSKEELGFSLQNCLVVKVSSELSEIILIFFTLPFFPFFLELYDLSPSRRIS
jgi:hypothetical protein